MKNLIGEQHGAMIIVTHDMELARQMDRCLYLVGGKLSDTPPPAATARNKKRPASGVFFHPPPALDMRNPMRRHAPPLRREEA